MLGRITRWADTTLHPAWFHGEAKRPPYFEGWYFKMVSMDERSRFAVIPGIFISDDPEQHHAFVQVFDGASGHATYHRYPAGQFQWKPGTFDLAIGSNHFTMDGIRLDIADELRTVSADLRFSAGAAWPVSIASPGIMGPFGWIPIMECNHGVLSLDHALNGQLIDNGMTHDFGDGRGYIEKDWGKSFPAGWVWMQTNHFLAPETSLTASIAVTPFAGGWFPGFIVGVWHAGQLHRFATYTGARVEKLEIHDDHVLWVMRSRRERLEIFATRAEASLLPGPNRVEMGKRVPETLKATVQVCLTTLDGNKTLLDDTGRCAGLEVAGEIDRLQGAVRR